MDLSPQMQPKKVIDKLWHNFLMGKLTYKSKLYMASS